MALFHLGSSGYRRIEVMDMYWHTMGVFSWLMTILFLVVVAAIVIWLIRSTGSIREPHETDALSILQRRLAGGEIDPEEFEERKRLLDRP
jgi:putative membrane protein